MKGIGYFQNLRKFLRNCLEIFGKFFKILGNFWNFKKKILEEFFWWNFFGRIFWRNYLGEIFCEDFFVRIFSEDFFGGLLVGFFGGGILCLHWNIPVCQDFGVMKEGSRIFNP